MAVAAVLALLTPAALLATAPAARAQATDDADTGGGAASRILLRSGQRVEVTTPDEDGVLTFGSGRRVVGDVTIAASPDGLAVVNTLPLEDYVRGVAEMPGSWPAAALEAQAIAARTYAWYQLRTGAFADEGHDICATTACQVYDGVRQVEGLLDRGWADAVAATEGQVLLDDDGAPVLARYFSTSGGRTRANGVVFPNTGDLSHLHAIDDPWDEIAPLHTWQVTFTRDELDAILARGERLRAASPMADVTAVEGSDGRPRAVRVTGADGTVVEVGAASFRTFVSTVAPDLFPDRFPGARPDGRSMPATLPSSQVAFDVTDDEVVVDGRGWGHAVGMGQWGARGRAEDGQTTDEILAAYYGGLAPTTSPDLPEQVRVGLGTPEGPLTVRADGEASLAVDGEVVAPVGFGTFTITRTPNGLSLHAPPGWGRPLELAAPRVPDDVRERRDLEVVLDVNKAARLDVAVTAGGQELARSTVVADGAGAMLAVVRRPDDGWPETTLDVAVTATDERGDTVGQQAQVEVSDQPPPPTGTELAVDDGGVDATGPTLLVAILGATLAALWLLVSRGEGRPRGGNRARNQGLGSDDEDDLFHRSQHAARR